MKKIILAALTCTSLFGCATKQNYTQTYTSWEYRKAEYGMAEFGYFCGSHGMSYTNFSTQLLNVTGNENNH